MSVKKLFIYSLLSVLFITGANISLSAQNYIIRGKVKDYGTGDPLPGASIVVKGTQKGAVANIEGVFVLKNINQKKIELTVTFMGYEPYTQYHDFSKKNNPFYNISLRPSAAQLDEVVVNEKAKGQVKALLDQKKAENIKNIVSAEQIEQFPDMNAAEAMQRIPGITLQKDQGEGRYVQLRGTPPELTNFNINGEQIPSPEGDVRYVGMDIISADQIEFIEITKVLTPDMDADGIGGTVNIITKKAKSEKPKINATLAGGYNNLRKTNNYQVQFAYGQRYKKFGFNINGSYYRNDQGSDNMEFKYAKGPFWGRDRKSVV